MLHTAKSSNRLPVTVLSRFLGGANLLRTEEQLVEMTNGCICCTLPDDLLQEVRKLSEDGRFDYLLIEGISIAESLRLPQLRLPRRELGGPVGGRPPDRGAAMRAVPP